ncbi:MAG TPA: hypothetical protein DD383_05790 [Rikenellaceae bacterium]|nr:hypothetical protein [Rikenellaceae bacterium]
MTELIEKAGIGILLSLCLLLSFGCTDYSPDIEEVDKRLDALEDNRIASIDGQIAAINASLPLLEKADADLKGMIENLRKTAAGLEDSISENEKSGAALRADIENAAKALEDGDRSDKEYILDSLGKAKAVLLALLESGKTEMDGKLALIDNAISDLKKKDENLENKISDLKTYIDKELKGAKDWFSATFMTLGQYDSIVEQLGGINGEIDGLKTSMADLETRLSKKYSEDLKTAMDGVKSKLGKEIGDLGERIDKKVADITNAYTAAVATARDEMDKWWNESLKKTIDDCETSMKRWVNETLTGYWTIEEVKAELEAQMADIQGHLEAKKTFLNGLINANVGDLKTLNDRLLELDGAVAQNAADLKTFENDLAQAKTDLTNAYTAAINDAVTKFEGSFPDEIKTQISSVNSELDKKKADIEGKVTSLETSVDELEAKLSAFLNASQAAKIQSVSWFPTSTDGKETLYYDKGDPDFPESESYKYIKYIKFRFEVRPASEAANITADLLSARLLYTKTRAAAGEDVVLDITDFKNEKGIITVTIDASKVDKDVIDKKISSSVAVAVGNVSTEYVPLKAQALGDPLIRYETTDGKMLPDSEIKGVRAIDKIGFGCTREHTYGRIDFIGEIGQLDLNLERKPHNEDENATLKKIKVCRKVAMSKSSGFGTLRFCNQYRLVFADLEKLDVSQVDDFARMFKKCTNLSELKISSWKPKPEDMYHAFYECRLLKTLDLSGWDMSQINKVTNMFYWCCSLRDLYLDKWDLTNYEGTSTKKFETEVFSGIQTDRHDLNIYVRNSNKKTVDAVKRWVNNSEITPSQPHERVNYITK